MGSIPASMLPKSFGGIELRGIRWQGFDLQPAAVVAEPRPDIRIFVVGSVVLNQNSALAAVAWGNLPLQEG